MADILAGDVGEALGAYAVKAERDDRLVGALVEAGACVGQALAAQRDAILDRILMAFLVGHYGDARVARLAGNHVERHLRGRAEQFAQTRRVLQAGKLDEDAVGADALDRRFGDADLVDALAHDFEALVDRLVDALGDTGVAQGEGEPVAFAPDKNVRRRRERRRLDG